MRSSEICPQIPFAGKNPSAQNLMVEYLQIASGDLATPGYAGRLL
jgi:hypothetical protein